ncbi:MATE family efflux transporter [Blautia schinkii]|nr:MATE family efflux transporter [Blautia schinkii]
MKTEQSRDFTKKLLTIIFPIAFQQFMLALVSASDALMLGMLTQNSLSAVSLASQVTFVENLFFAAMTIGLSMLAAQYWGKKDRASVERIFAYVMKITTCISFLFFLAGLCFPSRLMHLFTNEKVLLDGGSVYLRTVSLSFLLTGISQVYLCTLKNTGEAVKSSVISSVSVVVNIFLNAVLIFGLFGFPKLEIAGAAMATVLARLIEVVWCILETGKPDRVKLRLRYMIRSDWLPRHFKSERTAVCEPQITHSSRLLRRDFWKYTAPVLGNEIVWGIGFTMYSVIMGHLGTDAVAANSIANIVKNLVACFCLGLGSGGGIMVGNALGAGRLDIAKEYGRKLCKLSVLCGVISGIILLSLSPLILAVTDLSDTANMYLKWMLIMCSYYMIGKSINGTTIAGIFCAGGDSQFGFRCDIITLWCVTVPLGLIAAFVLKLPVLAVYFIVNLDEIIKLPAVYRNYKKYKWVKDLTVKENLQ